MSNHGQLFVRGGQRGQSAPALLRIKSSDARFCRHLTWKRGPTLETFRTARGFTLVELLMVVAIIGIIAVIAVPGLLRARMSGNEASAIGSLRAINSAESTYALT